MFMICSNMQAKASLSRESSPAKAGGGAMQMACCSRLKKRILPQFAPKGEAVEFASIYILAAAGAQSATQHGSG